MVLPVSSEQAAPVKEVLSFGGVVPVHLVNSDKVLLEVADCHPVG